MFASILIALAAAGSVGNAIPIDASKALHSAHNAVFYSLEPWSPHPNPKPALYGFSILGEKRIDGPSFVAVVKEFEAAVERSDDRMAACFDPRHAIRVTSGKHRYEFLLCYACHQMAVYRDGKRVAMLGAAGSSKPLNALLAQLNLPLSQSYDEDAELVRAKRSQEDYRRWREAMPHSLLAFEIMDEPVVGEEVIAQMAIALANEHPNGSDRILTLFGWFGSGAGPWSGFPAYEDVPEQLLLMHSTGDLLVALDSTELSQAQLDGAARLFGGWTFGQKRPADGNKLPIPLKARLLARSLQSADKDKRDRAMHAFGLH
jgi:hypothetical protein